jgi:pre-mRNA-splicing factor RBM22/SLT11
MWQSQGRLCRIHRVAILTSSFFRHRCAFVNFKDRVSAERAAEAWANGLDMDGERLDIRWGRSKNPPAPTPSAIATAVA